MSETPKIIEDFLKGNNDAGGTIASLEDEAKKLVAKIEELETSKGIDQRALAYSIATKSCEVLGVNITAEKLWSLVEAIQPILESGLTQRAPDVCPVCAGTGYKRISPTMLADCRECNGTGQRR